jgi:hypothetical protein
MRKDGQRIFWRERNNYACSARPEETKYAISAFYLKIKDSKGEEELNSAEDYCLPYYPNDTKQVSLTVSARGAVGT